MTTTKQHDAATLQRVIRVLGTKAYDEDTLSVMFEDFSRVFTPNSEKHARAELRHFDIPADSSILEKNLSGMFLMKTCEDGAQADASLQSVCLGDDNSSVTLTPISLMTPENFS